MREVDWMPGDMLATADYVLKIVDIGDDYVICSVGRYKKDGLVFVKGKSAILTDDELISFMTGNYPARVIEIAGPVQDSLF